MVAGVSSQMGSDSFQIVDYIFFVFVSSLMLYVNARCSYSLQLFQLEFVLSLRRIPTFGHCADSNIDLI